MKQCIICDKWIHTNTIYCPYCGEFNSISGRNFEDASSDEIIEAMHEAEQRKQND